LSYDKLSVASLIGRKQTISRHLSSLSCFVYRQTEAAALALPGRCSGVIRVISARRQKICPRCPHHLDTPLYFVLRRPSVWYAGHGRGEANKRSTDSKHGETGDNYPAHNRPIVGWLLVSILGSREIPFPGSRKKMGDSRLSSPVNIPTSRCRIIHVLTCRPTAIIICMIKCEETGTRILGIHKLYFPVSRKCYDLVII